MEELEAVKIYHSISGMRYVFPFHLSEGQITSHILDLENERNQLKELKKKVSSDG